MGGLKIINQMSRACVRMYTMYGYVDNR